MENGQEEGLLSEAIQQALSGKQRKFELITSLDHYRWCKELFKKTHKVADTFANLHKLVLNEYLRQTAIGEQQDLELVAAMKRFEVCAEFYGKDADTAKDMMKEYRVYLRSGHFLDSWFGGIRPDYEMVDYRTLPWRLF